MTDCFYRSQKKMSAGLLFFVFATTFSFNAPAAPAQKTKPPSEKLNIYKTIPSDKSLLTSPQFILIDDFNSKKLANYRGAKWQAKKSAKGRLDLSFDKQDARMRERGFSLKVQYKLLSAKPIAFQSLLNRLDVSKATHLIFKTKMQAKGKLNAFSIRLQIQLTDWKNKTVSQIVPNIHLTDEKTWEEVSIPIGDFKELDIDQLYSIRFVLSSDEEVAGSIWIDEIAFYGQGDVSFESHKDNLVGFPRSNMNASRRLELLEKKRSKKLLKAIAQDTWKYFENARDKKTHLIVDHLRVGENPLAADYTSTTNIAIDLLATIAAMDLDFISEKEAKGRIRSIFKTLKEMKRYKGFFYNFYDTKKLNVTRDYISTVDSGWFAIALVVVRQAFEDLYEEATEFLNSFSFDVFFDNENNQLVVGIDVPERNFGRYHYGLLATEARATSFYAIGKGDLPELHWWFLFRTPPAAWKWQNQVPQGKQIVKDNFDYFQGYYTYKDKKFVPSWGGSLFEFLMPTLVMKERKMASKGLGLNNKIVTEIHRDYALKEKKYPVWGISPAATSNGKKWRYAEYGIKALSAKGYPDQGVITPHVSFLALDSLPDDAIKNIRKLLEFDIYGEYGFYDSINFPKIEVNPQYLALDQGMILVALCNYLEDGSIQDRFHKDPIAKKAERLLSKESFFID